jgi:hypothetical protein
MLHYSSTLKMKATCYSEIPVNTYHIRSRDSSVGIATGYGLDNQEGREFESW